MQPLHQYKSGSLCNNIYVAEGIREIDAHRFTDTTTVTTFPYVVPGDVSVITTISSHPIT